MFVVGGVFWLWGARYLAEDTRRAVAAEAAEAPASEVVVSAAAPAAAGSTGVPHS
jgi:hypothetical protein